MGANALALEQLVRQRGLAWTDELADEFVRTAQSRVSRRSGATHDSIESEGAIDAGDFFVAHVKVGEESGIYQDQGTGIYGPEGTRIYPKKAGGVLVFDWPAAGGIVFARSVQGSPGTHFWSEAVGDWPFIVRRVT